jgi:antitoxin (DNA-binding transcriptional repressor) of toxin-antitoxin stability system
VRVAFLVGEVVVLAMHGRPIARRETAEQPHMEMHDRACHGVQFQPTMGDTAVHKDRGEEQRYLHECDRDHGQPE